MQPVSNPPGRFDAHSIEWEVEPPPAELQVFEDSTRAILSENDSPDVGFRFSVNPYRGCTHACAYCYARPSHEYLGFGAGTDFETKIVVKLRAPELLREALASRAWKGDLIAFSGDTDCYQPLEAHYRLTRRCLEVCRDVGNPVGLITKSFLVARDRDVLADLAREGLAAVSFSIAFLDEDLARAMEPGAPRPCKRFEAMRLLADAGVPTRIMIGPLVPGLNDDQVPKLLERAHACGARAASMVLLRLPGNVRPVFLERLRAKLPLRADRVEARLREVRGGAITDPRFGHRMHGSGTYWELIENVFELNRRRLGLDARDLVPSSVPPATFRRPGQLTLFA